jgi:HSP20 family molecular chaperone IbpA
MTNKNNDFFGLKVSPVDLLMSVVNDALTKQQETAATAPRESHAKSPFDNFANMGQGFFESFNVPNFFEEKAVVEEFTPAVDVLVSDTVATYIVGAPGVRQEDVTVELEDEKLTITIRSEQIIVSDKATRNWKGGVWSQSFVIPTGDGDTPKKIDEENISAVVENGLITVLVGYKAPKVTKIKVG